MRLNVMWNFEFEIRKLKQKYLSVRITIQECMD